ncbi:MAG: 3-dehydroquinate synthase [Chitinophagaceae bacterium]
MNKKTYQFTKMQTRFYFDADFAYLETLIGDSHAILVTDENVFKHHKKKFSPWKTIVLKPGEAHKQQSTVDELLGQLIAAGADRKTLLVGVGGGVVTDMTGYAASVYMRGIRFGFVPTTVLGMVDAAIGGKNGVDVGLYKNLVGTINQPAFLLYDIALLKSLPANEWVNGFAEIIKHGCIKDAAMFKQLMEHKISDYKKDAKLMAALIRRNALIKAEVVKADEFEQGERRLLNFGHTLGHAIENLYSLSHGEAIAVGMVAASVFSETLTGFKATAKVIAAFEHYGLPTNAAFDKTEVFKILQMDKKRERSAMNYVLLEKIGKGVVQSIPINELEKFIQQV